jgi:phosphate starvation-inducible protein PhoH
MSKKAWDNGTTKSIRLQNNLSSKTENQKDYIRNIVENDITICYGPAGTGKAQPLDSIVYTPDGPISMKDIQIGTKVCTPDGGIANVTNIFPQGEKDVYKIVFSDGSEVESCKEHLWKVWKNDYWKDSKVLELKDFKDDIKSNNKRKYNIKLTEPVYFNNQNIDINPYILGCLLGDGHFRKDGIFISSVDDEIINEFKKMDEYYLTNTSNQNDYRICKKYKEKNKIITFLEKEGLSCKKSYEKFVPQRYIYNSIEIRLDLLRGLMDTDGSISNKGHIEYSTTSKDLAYNVKEIVESLGGKVKIIERTTNYTYKNVKKQGRLSYRVSFVLDNFNPFKISRKSNLWNKRIKYSPTRTIESINFSRKVECQCIMIDSEDHMYLTNNFIQTHNTFIAAGLACQALARGDIESIILTRPMVQCSRGDTLGALKGTLLEKFSPYLMPLIYQMEYFLGKAQASVLISTDVIKLIPLELCRGMNFDNCFAILDESQNATYEQIKMFMTRIGKFSKLILNGDTRQSDLYDCDFKEIIDRLQDLQGVGISKLTKEDIQRNEIIGRILGRLEDE